MKIHTKKNVYRASVQKRMKAGQINNEAGEWRPRESIKDSSMRRDYHPQARGVGKQKGQK